MMLLPDQDNNRGSSLPTLWVTSVALIAATLVPSFIGMTGKVYFYPAFCLGLGLLFFVYRISSQASKQAARQLLKATVIYLPLLYLSLILDRAG
jgi:heme O synthase-like polyprenyltransferase